MPRFKNLHEQKLALPDKENADRYPNLQPIDWDLIAQQYDEMVKYATALRLGTAEAEAILKRFTRHNIQHPTYKALSELGLTFTHKWGDAPRRRVRPGLKPLLRGQPC